MWPSLPGMFSVAEMNEPTGVSRNSSVVTKPLPSLASGVRYTSKLVHR